jgi:hypothetical protein
MADKPKATNDNFIAKIVKDPKQVPDALMLTGYLGASSESNHTRLYFNAQLSSYVEIPDDGILNTQDYPGDALGGSFVWIKRDAVLIHGKAGTKAKFLEGPIVNDFMNVGGLGLGQGTGTANSFFICQETFQDFACGTTQSGFFCTILQPPTQQQGCPTQIHWLCPPPPTPNCPTHSNSPFVCHTQICEIKDAAVGQQQVQPLALTIQPQNCLPSQISPLCRITQIPQLCHPTLVGPNCVTHNSPICNNTAGNPACLTIGPTCFPTVGIICPSHTPACAQTLPPVCIATVALVCPSHTPACFPSAGIVCPTHTPACFQTLSPVCQHATFTPVCNPRQTLVCPSFGACPSIACAGGFGGEGNPGF